MPAAGTGPVTYRAAVIGSPVAHSLSPVLHRAAYRDLGLEGWSYTARQVDPDRLPGLLEEVAAPAGQGPSPVWAGLSVTMPHKQAVMGLLDIVDPLAGAVGAVNTVVAQRPAGAGRALLVGTNTDVAGIVGALREARDAPGDRPGPREDRPGPQQGDRQDPQEDPGPRDDHPSPQGDRQDQWDDRQGLRALVLGSGATASSALAALSELGASRTVVAARRHAGPARAAAAAHRMGLEVGTLTWSPGQAASDVAVAHELARADLVVSTLPARAADTLAAPLAAAAAGGLRPSATLLDVVYDPWPTALARTWQAAGGAVAPGWLMLLHQAAPQVHLMTGRRPGLAPMRAALLQALRERRA